MGKMKGLANRLWGYPVDRVSLANVDYDAYWRDKRKGDLGLLSDFQRCRADVVGGLIEDGASLLDVGCGNGAILDYLKDRKGIRGTGVDVSALVLDHVRTLGFDVVHGDFTDRAVLDSLPGADYVLALEVIEHIPNAAEVVTVLAAKARKAVILSVPNTGYFVHRLRLLCGKCPCQWRLSPSEHLRFWTLADAKWWVRALGMDLVSLVPYEGLPGLSRALPSCFAAGLVMKIASRKDSCASLS